MKKTGFIITETIFSIILAASVAAVGVLAYDLNTDQFHLDRYNPFVQEDKEAADENSKKTEDKKDEKDSSAASEDEKKSSEASDKTSKENSGESSEAGKDESDAKKEESGAEGSKTEESSGAEDKTVSFLTEPEELSEQPDELMSALGMYGYDLGSLMNGNKLIMVDTTSSGNRTKAIVYCFEKSDSGYWWNVAGTGKPVTDEAYIGENGSNFDPAFGSKITPGGVFTVGKGFYIDEKPDSTYDMFRITEDTYWVTDPASESYNKLVEGTENKDWSKAEHMITSEKSYKYGLVTNYNVFEPDKTRASAIFVCCGNAPTEGSIALPENIMKTIIEWLDDKSIAMIFVNV